MKRLFFAVATALIAVACSPKFETVEGDPLKTKIYTLDNGLKVYMSVNKDEPRLQTAICVRVGGKNDPAETTGMAHYFEHLMFKGTKQFGTSDYASEEPLLNQIEELFEVYRKTSDQEERNALYHQIDSLSYEASKFAIPNEYDKLMSAIGASGTNAFTSDDMTCYIEDIPSNQIDNWARIQADRFQNAVIRGFHTELETIYEEKNMSLTQDNRKAFEALNKILFPNHPYGQQTVIGTQEHLKNPSITLVKNYHKTYYVPNNMAICLSGDFNPKEIVRIIEKHFGGMQPNPDLPVLDAPALEPLETPASTEVYGLESPYVILGWRIPGLTADYHTANIASICSDILCNGKAGLIDLNINQQQKILGGGAEYRQMPDYCSMIAYGEPKNGQTIEEVRDILLEEFAKLRNGEFTEDDVKACVANARLAQMEQFTSNNNRAMEYAATFAYGIPWEEEVKSMSDLETITKEDIVAFANKYLGAESYAAIYKRQGEDTTIQKITAPAITPIVTNRDLCSDFLSEIQNTPVKPIEPVFVDFSKDMSITNAKANVDMLYKENDKNDIFTVRYIYNLGKADDATIGLASSYLSYLGTSTMTAEDIARKMYALACNYSISCNDNQFSVAVGGLRENMGEALAIVENLIADAQPNDAILNALKYDIFQSRINSKTNQKACVNALARYMTIGPEHIAKVTLTNEQLLGISSEQLLSSIRELVAKQHEIIYYGPESQSDALAAILSVHNISDSPEPLEQKFNKTLRTDNESIVYLAQYDAKQLYYYQYSNRGETFNPEVTPDINIYNEYFGQGMNSITFQEMREARGLAYSASAGVSSPVHKDGNYTYTAFIATQNDKMQQAIEAFAEIIENMPQSEQAFNIAKQAILGRLRTERTTGMGVFSSYLYCRNLGLEESPAKYMFEKTQDITFEDVVATQQQWATGRTWHYAILGDLNDLDMDYLKTLGTVKVLSLEEIFGY